MTDVECWDQLVEISFWRSIHLHPVLLPRSTVPHAHNVEILGVSTLLSKKELFRNIINTNDPVIIVILISIILFMAVQFLYQQSEYQIGNAPYCLPLLMNSHNLLDLKQNFQIPEVIPICYGNVQTYCHFKSTEEINFLWIDNKIVLLLLRSCFSYSVLMRGILKPFLIVPNLKSGW